jgi:hypothetical protein
VKRFVFVFACACASPIEVVKVTTPADAERANGTKLHAAFVIRGDGRAALPEGVTVDAKEVVVPRPGIFTYTLDQGDSVVRDAHGVVTGVKSGDSITRFIAGTANVDGDAVKGELEGHAEHVPLFPGDRIELHGTFAPHESVPLDGKVEVTRAWSALVFGGVLLGGAWLPSVIVGATSGVDANHWLFLPILGPFIAYGTRDACPQSATDPTSCFADSGTRIALAVDGALQATGVLLMIIGLPTSSDVRWGVTPTLGGLSIHGTF